MPRQPLYHLDTNTIVAFLRGRAAALARRLEKISPGSFHVSQIVRAELLVGCRKSQRPEASLRIVESFLGQLQVVDFGAQAAEHYADIRAVLEKSGVPIGPNDLLIAAVARAAGATLVTANIREFKRVPALRCEDWS